MKDQKINVTKIKDERGKIGYASIVGNADLNKLAIEIQNSLNHLFYLSAQDLEFNGSIDIYIHHIMNQINPELKELCERIIAKNNTSSLNDISRMLGVNMRVRISHGQDNLIAENSSSVNLYEGDESDFSQNTKSSSVAEEKQANMKLEPMEIDQFVHSILSKQIVKSDIVTQLKNRGMSDTQIEEAIDVIGDELKKEVDTKEKLYVGMSFISMVGTASLFIFNKSSIWFVVSIIVIGAIGYSAYPKNKILGATVALIFAFAMNYIFPLYLENRESFYKIEILIVLAISWIPAILFFKVFESILNKKIS